MTAADIRFSVCIPLYNGREWIAETLASVERQTHPHWEVIVVEDASPVPSRDLVEAFAARVPQRVVYHVNAANLRTPHTRDEAHRLARHDHIAPLDCDDVWQPEHLAEFAAILAARDADLVFTGCTCFTDRLEDGVVNVPSPAALRQLRLAYQAFTFWTQPSSVAFHRRLLERFGPWSRDIELKRRELAGLPEVGEDRNFLLRLMCGGVEPQWTGTVTTGYRQHPGSQRHRARFLHAARAWIDHHHGLMPDLPAAPQRAALAQSCANGGRALRADPAYRRLAARFYWRAWRWHPLHLHRLAQAAAARLGWG